ncbi:protein DETOXIFICATION 35 [Beta vulgaris subsp. vulgaris]|uniref:protein DETOXIFICATION 35 n=1 Tax=Beta vulgaris subsp. vulgaris TaxID=3555 RepID=UPI0020372F8B|nr:protein DETOXIFICATION 35 [Beta vulgaris subsp. vulgaris]
MEAPLLNDVVGNERSEARNDGVVVGDAGDYADVNSVKEAASVFWIESLKLWKIAAPLVFNILCQYASNSLTNIFVGHLGELELSAVSISLSVIGAFSFGFMLGMGSALETLCGQAFGAGQVYMLGIYMQRSWIILSISCLVLLPIYIFAAPMLIFLGQDHAIANLAGQFTLLTIPQLFSLAFNFPTQKFLQAQSKVDVLAWIGFIALIEHVVLLYLFISVFGWGLLGAAAAFNITSWMITIAQVVYVIGWCKDAWSGFSWLAFSEMWAFVRLSVASAVMLCLELWYMMSITLLAGHLANAVIAVGSLSICMNVNGIEAMIFIGINAAISVRVSNELGLQHPRAAKYSVYVTVFQSLLIGLLCMVLILVARDSIAVIYTDSKELQQAVSKLAWLLGVTMVLNSVQPVISGVAVGGGWQALVAYINLACYYVFGLPLGYILGYVADYGVMGIWVGMIAGTILQTLILLFICYRTNWTKEVEETTSRMRKWGGQDIKADKIVNNT